VIKDGLLEAEPSWTKRQFLNFKLHDHQISLLCITSLQHIIANIVEDKKDAGERTWPMMRVVAVMLSGFNLL